jgi:hypothetical protein
VMNMAARATRPAARRGARKRSMAMLRSSLGDDRRHGRPSEGCLVRLEAFLTGSPANVPARPRWTAAGPASTVGR